MPSFRYDGLTLWNYPATRDTLGFLLGDVNPGDVRDLGEPPDSRWVPAGDGSERAAAFTPEPEPVGAAAGPETISDEAGVTGEEG